MSVDEWAWENSCRPLFRCARLLLKKRMRIWLLPESLDL